jgi:hypothetical protein
VAAIMQTEQLDEKTKAIVIEIADIFYEMDVEEIPENYPKEKEEEAHVNAICKQLKKAKNEGYTKYVIYNREEAEQRGQDLGINGVYLLVVRK